MTENRTDSWGITTTVTSTPADIQQPHPYITAWRGFSNLVLDHIRSTRSGHYAPTNRVEPLDFCEAFFGLPYLCGQVVKYVARIDRTRDMKDLYKAAHYMSRIYNQIIEEEKCPKISSK